MEEQGDRTSEVDQTPYGAFNPKEEDFPVTVKYFDTLTGELLKEDVITEPGIYHVPSFRPKLVEVEVIRATDRTP